MSSLPPTAAASAATAQSLWPYRHALYFGFSNATNWIISLGLPMVLLAEALGADTFQVGLAYSFIFLILPMQVVSTAWLPRFGYKAQMIFGWAGRNLFLFIPLGLALWAPASPPAWAPWLLVASVGLFCLVRAVGSGAYLPWMMTLLPPGLQGRFFASDQLVSGLAGFITLLFCAGCLRWLDPYPAFAVIYFWSIVGAWWAVYNLSRLPDVPRPAPISLRRVAEMAPQLCLRPSPFRHYLWFSLLYTVIANCFSPFVAYYAVTMAHIPREDLLLFGTLQNVGAMAGSYFLRGWIDRVPVASVFRVHLVMAVALYACWWLALGPVPGLLGLLPVSYVLAGLSVAFFNSANIRYLGAVTTGDERPLTMSVHAAVTGVIGGLATTLLGAVLKGGGAAVTQADGTVVAAPAMNVTAFAAYFAVAVVVQLLLWLMLRRFVAGPPAGGPITGDPLSSAMASAFRPFRQLVALAGLVSVRPPPTASEPVAPPASNAADDERPPRP